MSRENLATLRKGRQVVVVQGLGVVGTAVATAVAIAKDAVGESLYHVIGLELPTKAGKKKVDSLITGHSPVVSSDSSFARHLEEAVACGNLSATVDCRVLGDADIILVEVPIDVTDIDVTREEIEVQSKPFLAALCDVGRYMRPECLVIVETTLPVGGFEHLAVPVIRAAWAQRGLTSTPRLAHAPERVMSGRGYLDSVRRMWRTYAGINAEAAEAAAQFLATYVAVDTYPPQCFEQVQAAELGKLLENSYRAVTIALMHEWALLAEQAGVDLFSVVRDIRRRQGTHDNMRTPGLGVGGHCLTKDGLLAQWSATHLIGSQVTLDLTLQALAINRAMPLHVVDLVRQLLGTLNGRVVALLGVAYIEETDLTRYSPSEVLAKALEAQGAIVRAHDPFVRYWQERPLQTISSDPKVVMNGADVVILAVRHQVYQTLTVQTILDACGRAPAIVDAFDILTDEMASALHDAGCLILGVGKGHWYRRGYHQKRIKKPLIANIVNPRHHSLSSFDDT